MGRFSDGLSGMIALVVMIGSFCLWAFGVAVCWRADQLFWAVVSFAMPPIGFVIGLYNWIF